jgi:hypothetical protein
VFSLSDTFFLMIPFFFVNVFLSLCNTFYDTFMIRLSVCNIKQILPIARHHPLFLELLALCFVV